MPLVGGPVGRIDSYETGQVGKVALSLATYESAISVRLVTKL